MEIESLWHWISRNYLQISHYVVNAIFIFQMMGLFIGQNVDTNFVGTVHQTNVVLFFNSLKDFLSFFLLFSEKKINHYVTNVIVIPQMIELFIGHFAGTHFAINVLLP